MICHNVTFTLLHRIGMSSIFLFFFTRNSFRYPLSILSFKLSEKVNHVRELTSETKAMQKRNGEEDNLYTHESFPISINASHTLVETPVKPVGI
jgi:hypothetical protein